MESGVLRKWLQAWGYTDSPGALHLKTGDVPASHPYRTEVLAILDPAGAIRAKAVFDVEGVPTVCFIEGNGQRAADASILQAVRERAWNQNLVSIVLAVAEQEAVAIPTAIPDAAPRVFAFQQAHPFGEFSCADIQSGDVCRRHPDWFALENRVDRRLLNNLSVVVTALQAEGLSKLDAQLLMAQVMFVAYLEHRGIVGADYRAQHEVDSLFDLVRNADRAGIVVLIDRLKEDFNGDILGAGSDTQAGWGWLSDRALGLIDDFLDHADLESGQKDFWRYDFRFIPVELISGVYESFLSDEKKTVGAYYTPRHLATLAVDQAFARTADILQERVYDGACGSGILLTTAFRRMLAHAEAVSGRQWRFSERVDLLRGHIFGSDINKSACKVTAFSLYLSVLEHLQPADIAQLTAQGESKLPTLIGNNIQAGAIEGDFFSSENPHLNPPGFTIFLSNPPWVEPNSKEVLTADIWAKERKLPIPRRQVSAAFVLRALDAVDNARGLLCFILPVSILAAPTSQEFVREFLRRYALDTVINFGDLRKLLFDNARQPTLVIVARPRRQPTGMISRPETFDYWVPKADISFAFGRLTLHGTDRHRISTAQLRHNNAVLTNLFWGTEQDQATIGRLELLGSVGKLEKRRKGWRTAKGFHRKDSNAEGSPVSIDPIAHIKFLDAKKFAHDGPWLDSNVLGELPADITEVARLPDDLLTLFHGPRIVFTDGMTPQRGVCAAFSTASFSFTSSIGSIQAPECDADLLRFLCVYLHSDLVRYVLLLSAYQISFERERATLRDIKNLPFVDPENHDHPERAGAIVREVAGFVRELESADTMERRYRYDAWEQQAQALIGEYFGLSCAERARIQELVELVLPSVQPGSSAALQTPLQARASEADLKRYSSVLIAELGHWRDEMGGTGEFHADLMTTSASTHGALGILKLDVLPPGVAHNPAIKPELADAAVKALLGQMKRQQLLPVQLHSNLYLTSDIVIQQGNSLYLVKPLVRRLWLQAEAVRDAERVVLFAQGARAR